MTDKHYAHLEGQGALVEALGTQPIEIIYGSYANFSFFVGDNAKQKIQDLVKATKTKFQPLATRFGVSTQTEVGDQARVVRAHAIASMSEDKEKALIGAVQYNNDTNTATVAFYSNPLSTAIGDATALLDEQTGAFEKADVRVNGVSLDDKMIAQQKEAQALQTFISNIAKVVQ